MLAQATIHMSELSEPCLHFINLVNFNKHKACLLAVFLTLVNIAND